MIDYYLLLDLEVPYNSSLNVLEYFYLSVLKSYNLRLRKRFEPNNKFK